MTLGPDPRQRRAFVAACVAAVALAAGVATAAKPVVVVAPFRGGNVAGPEQTIQRALRTRAVVLGPSRYAAIAKKLVAESQSPEDIAAVATELHADWVVTGTIKPDGARWALGVSLRDAKTGRGRTKLRYPLNTPRCPPAVLRTLQLEIVDALQSAIESPQPIDEPPRPRPGGRKRKNEPAPGDDDEAPPSRPGEVAKKSNQATTAPPPEGDELAAVPPPPVKKEPTSGGRPRWAHWFEVGLGGSISGRSFSVNPPPPKFSSAVVGGLRVDLTLYPLAFTWGKVYGLFSGLGLGLTLDKPFWLDSTSATDPTQRFPTTELRVEGGLRWKLTLYKPMPRPQLTLLVQGGLHDFSFAKGPMGEDVVGVPDVRYVYASIGGGLTIHFAEWSWLWLSFVYHAVTDSGPIQSPTQYGLAAAYGLRFSGGLDFLVWKGIRVGVQAMYERFAVRFGYDPNNRMKVADGATDVYYGGMLMLGYVL